MEMLGSAKNFANRFGILDPGVFHFTIDPVNVKHILRDKFEIYSKPRDAFFIMFEVGKKIPLIIFISPLPFRDGLDKGSSQLHMAPIATTKAIYGPSPARSRPSSLLDRTSVT